MGPALKWNYEAGILKLYENNLAVVKELRDLHFKDGKIHGVNSIGKSEVFKYMPPKAQLP